VPMRVSPHRALGAPSPPPRTPVRLVALSLTPLSPGGAGPGLCFLPRSSPPGPGWPWGYGLWDVKSRLHRHRHCLLSAVLALRLVFLPPPRTRGLVPAGWGALGGCLLARSGGGSGPAAGALLIGLSGGGGGGGGGVVVVGEACPHLQFAAVLRSSYCNSAVIRSARAFLASSAFARFALRYPALFRIQAQ
jgi:hypothetical protein